MNCKKLVCIAVLTGAYFGPALAASEMPKPELLASLNALHQRQAELMALADERAQREEIDDLAETLRQDHIILHEWLMQAAEGDVSDAAKPLIANDAYQQLQELEGEEFDAAFLRYQTQLHEQALELLAQNRPEDSELSSYANLLKVTHEAMRRHLALIQAEQR
jgi:uncharacterized protein (DUF305 family)